MALDYDKSSCPLNGQWKTSIYNIVNGKKTIVTQMIEIILTDKINLFLGQPKTESTKKFNLVSGNHILPNARKEPLTLS